MAIVLLFAVWIVFNNVLSPLPYSPLHLRLRADGTRSSGDLVSQQLVVARAEMALSTMLPPLFSLGDTLAPGGGATSAVLAESVSSKVRVVAAALDLLLTLLRVEGVLHVRSPGSMASGLAALNITGRTARRRVRAHDPWAESGSDDSDSDDDGSGEGDDSPGDDD